MTSMVMLRLMPQTPEGADKVAARRLGVSVDEYRERRAAGEKHCVSCRGWRPRDAFGVDRSRFDGLAAACLECRKARHDASYVQTPRVSRTGLRTIGAREGDKVQARAWVNLLVKTGRLPKPNDVPCTDCGHVWTEGERRHEYDHFLGYAAEHHEHVQAVCTTCHRRRDKPTHCKRGHAFASGDVTVTPGGTRVCRACRRMRESSRRDAAYWRVWREKRKAV